MSLVDDLVIRKPKFLICDIETMATLAYVYDQWKTNVVATERDWFMVSFSYRWWGDDGPIKFVSLPDKKSWRRNPEDDKHIVKALMDLFEEADAVCAYNAQGFDVPKLQGRMFYHQFTPTSSFQVVDPLLVIRKHFKLYSNSLKEVARYLGLDTQKLGSVGFDTWKACVAGDEKAWARMREYNDRDIEVLEEIYRRVQPWVNRRKPNMNFNFAHFASEQSMVCPSCGVEALQLSGKPYRTGVSEFPEYHCNPRKGGCGARPRGRFRLSQYGGGVKAQ